MCLYAYIKPTQSLHDTYILTTYFWPFSAFSGAGAVDNAVSLRANDFEDALQYFSAVQADADCLITRNIKDFGFAKMEVLDSKTFLGKYQ